MYINTVTENHQNKWLVRMERMPENLIRHCSINIKRKTEMPETSVGQMVGTDLNLVRETSQQLNQGC
jgi:hypothetical protein